MGIGRDCPGRWWSQCPSGAFKGRLAEAVRDMVQRVVAVVGWWLDQTKRDGWSKLSDSVRALCCWNTDETLLYVTFEEGRCPPAEVFISYSEGHSAPPIQMRGLRGEVGAT